MKHTDRISKEIISELFKLQDSEYQAKAAKALYDAVIEYLY